MEHKMPCATGQRKRNHIITTIREWPMRTWLRLWLKAQKLGLQRPQLNQIREIAVTMSLHNSRGQRQRRGPGQKRRHRGLTSRKWIWPGIQKLSQPPEKAEWHRGTDSGGGLPPNTCVPEARVQERCTLQSSLNPSHHTLLCLCKPCIASVFIPLYGLTYGMVPSNDHRKFALMSRDSRRPFTTGPQPSSCTSPPTSQVSSKICSK